MSAGPWAVVVAPSVERSLGRLPEKVAAAIVEFVTGALSENPRRVGHPLQRELTGMWSARRGAYRVIYEIDDARRQVSVLRVDHRSDVYRPR